MVIDSDLAGGVVKVGDGRGFIVESKHSRMVITAVHCLPYFPPPISIADTGERTYQDLLGPLDGDPCVWCELIFADPVADIAVLDEPDSQQWYDENDAYHALVDDRPTFRIADPEDKLVEAWLLSLDGEWHSCKVKHIADDHPFALLTSPTPLWVEQTNSGIRGSMPGSPIIASLSGAAIGVVCAGTGWPTALQVEGGPNPRLTHHLPGDLLRLLI